MALRLPALVRLETEGGPSTVLRYVKATSPPELVALVSRLIDANAPLADVAPVVTLIRELGIPYDFARMPNRELKIALFDPQRDELENGDDAVRWLCWRATEKPLLIKDRTTIAAVTAFAASPANPKIIEAFLGAHAEVLARVFNRHQRLLVPLKGAGVGAKRLVNRISRLSKTLHVPVGIPASKTVIARAARGESVELATSSLVDRFRYLNLIEYKLLGLPTDAFNIRNGKIWTALERPVLDASRLTQLKYQVLESLKNTLAPLGQQPILLDPTIDYGLPISRKQTLGNLPFGTSVQVAPDRKISAGIYWRNEWGAYDLDLSAMDEIGGRIGWGQADSYGREDVTFSGDVTDARHGACEFFTVDPSVGIRRGLLVNIYRGNVGAKAEILVGYPSLTGSRAHRSPQAAADSWQDQTLLREKITLDSKQMLIGFLRGDRFVVYSGRLGSARISGGGQPVVARALSDLWTLKRLFEALEISFDTHPQPGRTYAHDLRYESFSLDKLERVFAFGKESSLNTG